MPTRFVPNPAFAELVLATPELGATITEVTKDVRDAARRLAPHREGFLQESIKDIVELTDGVWVGVVIATDFKGHWWEFGWRSRPHGKPFLRPALTEVLPGAPIVGGSA